MFKRWAPIVLAAAVVILVANDESFSNPQEILGRRYSREAGRLFKIDHNGEQWAVAPGVILVRFAPRASAADISKFQHSNQIWPAPRLTANAAGYRQFRFATDRDPLDVLTAVVAEESVQDACLDTEVKFFGDPYYGYGSSPAFVDTQLSTILPPLELDWTDPTDVRVTAPAIIEHFNVVEQIPPGFFSGLVVLPRCPFVGTYLLS
jgi:hypothetical protein